MRKIKFLVIPILFSLILLPFTLVNAQEEETTPDQDVVLEQEEVNEIMDEALDESYGEDSTYYEDPTLYEDYDTYDEEYIYDSMEDIPVENGVITAGALAFIATYYIFLIGVSIGSYILISLSWQKIAKEMKYENPWFAWIPVLESIMIFKLGGQNPWLLLLLLIPGLGAIPFIVFYIMALGNITQKRGYDKSLLFILLTGIGMYVLIYLLAWKPKTLEGQTQIPTPATTV